MNEMKVIERALVTYICELEQAKDGLSKNIRYTENEYNAAQAILAKIRDKRYGEYILYQP